MKSSSADLPAMPTQVNGGDLFGGLTKREMFAMNAPEMPSWFANKLYEDDINYRQIINSGLSINAESYLFLAWRAFYADALLAELERTK